MAETKTIPPGCPYCGKVHLMTQWIQIRGEDRVSEVELCCDGCGKRYFVEKQEVVTYTVSTPEEMKQRKGVEA